MKSVVYYYIWIRLLVLKVTQPIKYLLLSESFMSIKQQNTSYTKIHLFVSYTVNTTVFFLHKMNTFWYLNTVRHYIVYNFMYLSMHVICSYVITDCSQNLPSLRFLMIFY